MSIKPFTVLAEFETPPESYAAFLELCQYDSVHSVQDEPGCSCFDVLTPEDEPNIIVLYEVYADRAAFDAHKETPHYAKFSAGVESMGITLKSVRFLALRSGSAA